MGGWRQPVDGLHWVDGRQRVDGLHWVDGLAGWTVGIGWMAAGGFSASAAIMDL